MQWRRNIIATVFQYSKVKDEDADRLHGIACTEFVVFMEGMLPDEDNAPVLILSDLDNIYKTKLEQLGVTMSNRIHTTIQKDILLCELSDLILGLDTLLLFVKDIGLVL